jgi:hypothetical protein
VLVEEGKLVAFSEQEAIADAAMQREALLQRAGIQR